MTKFNVIECTVYSDYALILAGDVTGVGHEGLSMDHTHAVVKRLGFAQIPLVCVMLRYLKEATRYLMDMTMAFPLVTSYISTYMYKDSKKQKQKQKKSTENGMIKCYFS